MFFIGLLTYPTGVVSIILLVDNVCYSWKASGKRQGGSFRKPRRERCYPLLFPTLRTSLRSGISISKVTDHKGFRLPSLISQHNAPVS